MSDSRDENDVAFSWGIKRRRGGTNKDVQFYDSFTYDGVEYFLYDSVYLFKDGEAEPYVGKLVKIWEKSKARKVKVLWFFHPSEITSYLKGVKVLENELFLACGDGVGLANVNPLEAIAGKCNVVCISRDERNRQPSVEEVKMADYVFYRTFDVGNFTISDKLSEQIATVEVSLLLNKKDELPDLDPNSKLDNAKVEACIDKLLASVKDTYGVDEPVKSDGDVCLLSWKDDKGAKTSVESKCLQPEKHDGAGPSNTSPVAGQKNRSRSPESKQNELDDVTRSAFNVRPSENGTSSKSNHVDFVDPLDDKTKDNGQKSIARCGKNGAEDSAPSTTAPDKGKLELAKDFRNSTGAVGKMKSLDDRGTLDERPSKKPKHDSTTTPSSANAKNCTQKSAAVSNVSDKALKQGAYTEINGKGKLVKEFAGTSNDLIKKMKYEDVEEKSNDKLNKLSLPPSIGEINGSGKLDKEFGGTSNGPSKKKLKSGAMIEAKSNDKLHKISLKNSKDVKIEAYGVTKEVTRRPDDERMKAYTGWEGRMKIANEQGRLVLLQNLDPAYTSSDVEDLVWDAFGESCSANMIPRTAISNRHSGQAFVILKNKEAAQKVIRTLDQECLMLPNGRPLVGSIGVASSPEEQPSSSFPGHLVIDKLKQQKEAVSTSHSSQSNTLEYEMAIEWRLLQDRADSWWKKLYKTHGEQFRKLKARLKIK